MSDNVRDIRDVLLGLHSSLVGTHLGDVCKRAVDEIERLRTEVDEEREAYKTALSNRNYWRRAQRKELLLKEHAERELAEAKQGIFKPDHPTKEERRLQEDIAKLSAALADDHNTIIEKDKQIAELEQILRERDEEWDKDVGVMRSRIAELEDELGLMYHACRTVEMNQEGTIVRVERNRITEEQIDEFWDQISDLTFEFPNLAKAIFYALSTLGIVACPKCGGTKWIYVAAKRKIPCDCPHSGWVMEER